MVFRSFLGPSLSRPAMPPRIRASLSLSLAHDLGHERLIDGRDSSCTEQCFQSSESVIAWKIRRIELGDFDPELPLAGQYVVFLVVKNQCFFDCCSWDK